MTEIINLTPHTIHFINDSGICTQSFIPSGIVARISVEYEPLNISNMFANKSLTLGFIGLKFISTEFGDPINLPLESKTNVGDYRKLYIVSSILKSACPDRNDLIVPADLVRDESGNVIGCKAFSF